EEVELRRRAGRGGRDTQARRVIPASAPGGRGTRRRPACGRRRAGVRAGNLMEPLELAMFPLESALLPDQDLPLRIFEPRYGALVRHCLDTGDPFGVVLISRGREVGGGDSRCDVGVMSRIIECDDQGAGRYTLNCRTAERIRVHEWLPDDPYPRARVAPWPDEPGDEVSAAQLVDVEDR